MKRDLYVFLCDLVRDIALEYGLSFPVYFSEKDLDEFVTMFEFFSYMNFVCQVEATTDWDKPANSWYKFFKERYKILLDIIKFYKKEGGTK